MKNIDYSTSFRIPVDVSFTIDGLSVSANGVSIYFKGEVFSLVSDTKCDIDLSFDDTLRVYLKPHSDGIIREYYYFDGIWSGYDEITVAETKLSGIGVFIRRGDVSFFLSLDFPYSVINHEGSRITIGCDPLDMITKENIYTPHTLTIGACRLTGTMSGKYDLGEIEGFSEYILSRMPVNFRGERPITITTCITNRMTDVRDGRIFYSMYDNPTLTLDPETIKNEIRLCSELGIEYYQLFEGFYDWEKDGSTEQNLREIVKLGKNLGVRVGDYMTALELNCWHYNYHNRRVEDETMCSLRKDGTRYGLCYGDKRVVPFLLDTVVSSARRNNEEIICLDGNCAEICYDENHGHNPGSLYAHIRGLVEFMKSLNEISPYFLTWSNAGNWLEFMPKLVWYNQNVYLTDPHPREYNASLNNLKYYGDCRREQMVTVHEKYFVPYCLFSNCEYSAFRHSRVDDSAFFEYSILQSLAVTPNITFGELRTFLERTPSSKVEYVKSFIKKWLSFLRQNIDCWKNVFRLGNAPGAGANEAYAHMSGDHGFICLVNQNHLTQSFTFSLDESIGLKGIRNDNFILSEIYPGEYPISEQNIPCAAYGDSITIECKPHSVRFIEIKPFFDDSEIILYGISGRTIKTDKGYEISITAECGKEIPCGIYLKNSPVGTVSAETVPTVPKYLFPIEIKDLSFDNNKCRFALKMPRDEFKRELSVWHVDGSEEEHFLNFENSDFCGAYIHNLYRENQYATIFVKTTTGAQYNHIKQPEIEPFNPPVKRRSKVYETTFDIPFIEWPAMSCLYGYDEIIELVFKDCASVGSIKATIDGRDVPVYTYRYPPAPDMRSFYIELTGKVKSGTKPRLRLDIEWCDGEIRRFEKKDSDGAQVVGQ